MKFNKEYSNTIEKSKQEIDESKDIKQNCADFLDSLDGTLEKYSEFLTPPINLVNYVTTTLINNLPVKELERLRPTEVGAGNKYHNLKQFFEQEEFKLPNFQFKNFWKLSLFYKKPDLKDFLPSQLCSSIKKFNDENYFLLGGISKETIYFLFPIEIAFLIAQFMDSNPRSHIYAEKDSIEPTGETPEALSNNI